ncbi:MAG: hypothetical protein OXR66_00190 [Candidatus Woesearchaeota archaeon]|nr:hypothetical protein [Candidatus Woesearchaeota archaeon]
MADSCALCKKQLSTVFLDKIKGTYVKINGKHRAVCSSCQKAHKDLKAQF